MVGTQWRHLPFLTEYPATESENGAKAHNSDRRFDERELLARVRSVLRRISQKQPESGVEPGRNLAFPSEVQRHGLQRKDCGYCDRLKKEVLEPLVTRSELRSFARIRELDIDCGGKIRDFDGEKIRTRIFVKRYGIYATPTLLLVDFRANSV